MSKPIYKPTDYASPLTGRRGMPILTQKKTLLLMVS